MSKPKVIAISGSSGCGKTTLVNCLAKQYQCPSFHFDDYILEGSYPKDMQLWFSEGADVSLIATPNFSEEIINAKSTHSHADYIFVEEPFGRQRELMKAVIDYVILLDLPLEQSFTRVASRVKESSNPNAKKNFSNYEANYKKYFKAIYAETVAQVRRNCDLIIKSQGSVVDVASEVRRWLQKNAVPTPIIAAPEKEL